jgi:hypothetical protein
VRFRKLIRSLLVTATMRILAALLLGLIVGISFMAVSLPLHRLIHKDADDQDHECAITLFAQAQVLTHLAGPIFIAIVLGIISLILPPRTVFLPARPLQLPPGRGPPSLSC